MCLPLTRLSGRAERAWVRDRDGAHHWIVVVKGTWDIADDGALTLVHGDFRHGNLMIDENGVASVLDWELAYVGDPMADLGWLCVNSWRYGHTLPVGGFGTREQLFEGYEAAGGRRVDPQRVRFWETLGTLRWSVMCEGMMQAFRDGFDRSVERLAIGRRSSETEIDLLRLLSGRD